MAISTVLVLTISFHTIFALPTAVWQPTRPKQNDVANLPPLVAKKRAVLLVPGLWLHPFQIDRCQSPEMHDWQKPYSKLVKELSPDFDVYAFGFAQSLRC